jgi:uncharacterized membrane protein YccC
MVLLAPFALAQETEPTPEPFPRVRSTVLRKAAERINDLLVGINTRQLERASRLLHRAQALVDRIGDAAESRARRNYDVSAVREAIGTARNAIDDARSAIREQSERDYVLEAATDRNVRDRLRAVRDQLFDDLRVIRQKVRTAIGAVRDAARALRSVRRIDR